ncbi:cutinase family protein [Candidatus Bathyarchaeota archaeon]|nr:cutinase family protein [Candidatus Bathyarchaeota archaeon]
MHREKGSFFSTFCREISDADRWIVLDGGLIYFAQGPGRSSHPASLAGINRPEYLTAPPPLQSIPNSSPPAHLTNKNPHIPHQTTTMQSLATLLLATGALASPHTPRQAACPPLHVFGARETTAPAGFGTSGAVVDAIVQAHPGATSEAIDYPACGGDASCGGVAYDQSAQQGTAATATAVNAFNEQCPDAEIVLIGYSQVRSVPWLWFSRRNVSWLESPADELGRSNLRQRHLRRGRHRPPLRDRAGRC